MSSSLTRRFAALAGGSAALLALGTWGIARGVVTSPTVDARLADGAEVAGTAIVVASVQPIGNPRPLAVATDTVRYAATLHAGVPATAALRTSAGDARVVVAADDQARRQGVWHRQMLTPAGDTVDIAFAARNGAPVGETELRVGGRVVSRTHDAWLRARGGWLLASRDVITYRDGRELGRLRTEFHPDFARLGGSGRTSAGMAGLPWRDALVPIGRVVAAVVLPGTLGAQANNCAKEISTAYNTIERYLEADGMFGAALLSGNPTAMMGAAINLNNSYKDMVTAQNTLNQCVENI
jgi:hypothetical protein